MEVTLNSALELPKGWGNSKTGSSEAWARLAALEAEAAAKEMMETAKETTPHGPPVFGWDHVNHRFWHHHMHHDDCRPLSESDEATLFDKERELELKARAARNKSTYQKASFGLAAMPLLMTAPLLFARDSTTGGAPAIAIDDEANAELTSPRDVRMNIMSRDARGKVKTADLDEVHDSHHRSSSRLRPLVYPSKHVNINAKSTAVTALQAACSRALSAIEEATHEEMLRLIHDLQRFFHHDIHSCFEGSSIMPDHNILRRIGDLVALQGQQFLQNDADTLMGIVKHVLSDIKDLCLSQNQQQTVAHCVLICGAVAALDHLCFDTTMTVLEIFIDWIPRISRFNLTSPPHTYRPDSNSGAAQASLNPYTRQCVLSALRSMDKSYLLACR